MTERRRWSRDSWRPGSSGFCGSEARAHDQVPSAAHNVSIASPASPLSGFIDPHEPKARLGFQ